MASRKPIESNQSGWDVFDQERRGRDRRATLATVQAKFEAELEGAGRNISETGAFFVTSDDLTVQVTVTSKGKQVSLPAKLVRFENITPGTFGVAVEFLQPLDPATLS